MKTALGSHVHTISCNFLDGNGRHGFSRLPVLACSTVISRFSKPSHCFKAIFSCKHPRTYFCSNLYFIKIKKIVLIVFAKFRIHNYNLLAIQLRWWQWPTNKILCLIILMTAVLRTHFSCFVVYNKLYELVKYTVFFKVKFDVKYKQIQHILYLKSLHQVLLRCLSQIRKYVLVFLTSCELLITMLCHLLFYSCYKKNR